MQPGLPHDMSPNLPSWNTPNKFQDAFGQQKLNNFHSQMSRNENKDRPVTSSMFNNIPNHHMTSPRDLFGSGGPNNSLNMHDSTQEWQNGLRALLPTVNINFATGGGNARSAAHHNQRNNMHKFNTGLNTGKLCECHLCHYYLHFTCNFAICFQNFLKIFKYFPQNLFRFFPSTIIVET